ncbi:MAG: DUF423 domain-containing protein [Methylococcales bacterium]|jgi:uncharacterized membrane protein YgdD (TMEM256/DUF423 family)|nr:DUF423 domain-containing protein [Methylococcales bacterium]
MQSGFLFLGALSALIGVGMGAFGAHGLKAILSPEMLAVYQTGVTYQIWHALGLIAIALIRQQVPESKLLIWAGWLMFVGILIFSGSLYLLAILDLKWLGIFTPIGGVSFMMAWVLIAIFASKKQHHSRYENARN